VIRPAHAASNTALVTFCPGFIALSSVSTNQCRWLFRSRVPAGYTQVIQGSYSQQGHSGKDYGVDYRQRDDIKHSRFSSSDLINNFTVVTKQALQQTDGLMLGPGALLNSNLLSGKFVALSTPPELSAFTARGMLYYHNRTGYSVAHQWFREKLAATIKSCLADQA
jgi:DNA-binding transcriptional LysR family regulator